MPRASGANTRTVFISGAGRGIGHAVAERYRASGHTVVTPTRAELDLGDLDAVESYVQQMGSTAIDVLINNAGENRPLGLEDLARADLQRIVDVNVQAPFLLSRAFGVCMAERGWGRIVNVSSVYSVVSRHKRSMYTTTKSALNGLTKACAVELGPRGVLVNSVCPGFVDTDLTRQNNTPDEIDYLRSLVPLGRLASPAEIAELIYFLGSDLNTYITGQLIAIDGGFLCQ
jgi:3-oxoacyl-[acyl-carrier protein] reductase